jgi:hypothetical protein
MGWKTLKETYGIEHIVTVHDKGICIGSSMVHDLIVINPTTGKLKYSQTFSDRIKETYGKLIEAEPAELLSAINSEDKFSKDLKVYAFDDHGLVETLCEEYGYPNVTHDGKLMYENTFTPDLSQAVAWAKSNCKAGIEMYGSSINRIKNELSDLNDSLDYQKNILTKLEAKYPEHNEQINDQ